MESKEQMAGHPDEFVQPDTGFDPQEPSAPLIAGLGIATLITLLVAVLGIQAYFDHVKQEQVHALVEIPVADDYLNLRTQEDQALNSYKYVDKASGSVQIPVARAMELLAKEAADGKTKYFAKPYAVKVPGETAGPDGGTAAPTAAGSAPNSGGNAKPASK